MFAVNLRRRQASSYCTAQRGGKLARHTKRRLVDTTVAGMGGHHQAMMQVGVTSQSCQACVILAGYAWHGTASPSLASMAACPLPVSFRDLHVLAQHIRIDSSSTLVCSLSYRHDELQR